MESLSRTTTRCLSACHDAKGAEVPLGSPAGMWADGTMRVRNDTFRWWRNMAESGWSMGTVEQQEELARSTHHRPART